MLAEVRVGVCKRAGSKRPGANVVKFAEPVVTKVTKKTYAEVLKR